MPKSSCRALAGLPGLPPDQADRAVARPPRPQTTLILADLPDQTRPGQTDLAALYAMDVLNVLRQVDRSNSLGNWRLHRTKSHNYAETVLDSAVR